MFSRPLNNVAPLWKGSTSKTGKSIRFYSELGIHRIMEKILEVHGCCPIIWPNSWYFPLHSHGIHGVLQFMVMEFMAFSSSWSWNSWWFHIHSHGTHDVLIFIVMESWLYNLVHMNMSCMTIFVSLKFFRFAVLGTKRGQNQRFDYVRWYCMSCT